MEHTFTAGQLLEAADISRALYTQWKARGFIHVENPVSGTGNPQPYTFNDVFRIALLAELVKLKFPISEAVKHTAYLHGFKDSGAWLGIRRYPVIGLEEDKVGASWHSMGAMEDPLRAHILKDEQIEEFVRKFKNVILVSLDDIEKSVKHALGMPPERHIDDGPAAEVAVPEGFSLVEAMEKQIRSEGGTPRPRIAGEKQE